MLKISRLLIYREFSSTYFIIVFEQKFSSQETWCKGQILKAHFYLHRKAPGDAWYESGTRVCSYVAVAEMAPGSLQGG